MISQDRDYEDLLRARCARPRSPSSLLMTVFRGSVTGCIRVGPRRSMLPGAADWLRPERHPPFRLELRGSRPLPGAGRRAARRQRPPGAAHSGAAKHSRARWPSARRHGRPRAGPAAAWLVPAAAGVAIVASVVMPTKSATRSPAPTTRCLLRRDRQPAHPAGHPNGSAAPPAAPGSHDPVTAGSKAAASATPTTSCSPTPGSANGQPVGDATRPPRRRRVTPPRRRRRRASRSRRARRRPPAHLVLGSGPLHGRAGDHDGGRAFGSFGRHRGRRRCGAGTASPSPKTTTTTASPSGSPRPDPQV